MWGFGAAGVEAILRRKSMDSTQRTRPRTGGSPVGLVVFIILTVVFAVLAYWSFAKYQTAVRDNEKLQRDLSDAQAAKQKVADEDSAFKKVTGVDSPDALKEFVANVLTAARAEGLGTDVQDTAKDALNTGLAAISQLKIALDSLNSSYQTEVAANKSLADQKKAAEDEFKKALDERDSRIQALTKQLDDDRANFQARIDKEVADREALRTTFGIAQDAWKRQEAKDTIAIALLQNKLRELSGEGVLVEQPQGKVTQIDFRSDTVTLNIGSKAGVQPRMRFMAFSRDASGKPINKGVVEVVSAEPDVSLAKIVSREPNLAIGKGDSVYNLAGPKKKLFVFVGTPKDYTLDQWTNIVRASGGDVTDVIQKGDQVADYLVLGQFQEDDVNARKMINEARDFQLRIIKEDDLKQAFGK